MRVLFSAIFSASSLSLLPLFFLLVPQRLSHTSHQRSPHPRFRPKLISTFFHPFASIASFFPPPSLSCSVKSITRMGAVRRFSRGELGLNSVKCPVKHIKTQRLTFCVSVLSAFPRRWRSCGSTSTDSCLAWARRRSTRWSSTTWPNWSVLLCTSTLQLIFI